MTLSIISFLVGAGLGQRFKVMVLLPAFAVVLVLAVGAGVALAQTAWSIALTAIIAGTSLQIGYFVGIGVHHVLTAGLSWKSSSQTSPGISARHAAR